MNADAVYTRIVVSALGAVYVLLVAAVFFIGRRGFSIIDRLENQQNINTTMIAVLKTQVENLEKQLGIK